MPANYYPELPIVPFQRTPVKLDKLTALIAATKAPVEVKRMAYVMLRNESANGSAINCNNPGGIQADSGRWGGNAKFSGVFYKRENGTSKMRAFLAFAALSDAIAFTCERITARGLFVGGYAHKIYKAKITTPQQLADAYQEEWVTGDGNADPSPAELRNFLSMYRQAEKAFV